MERREEQIHYTCKDTKTKRVSEVRGQWCLQTERDREKGGECTIWRNLTISSIGFFLKPCGEDQTCVKWSHKTSDFLHLDPWHVIRCRSKDIPSVLFCFFLPQSKYKFMQTGGLIASIRDVQIRPDRLCKLTGVKQAWEAQPGPHRRGSWGEQRRSGDLDHVDEWL